MCLSRFGCHAIQIKQPVNYSSAKCFGGNVIPPKLLYLLININRECYKRIFLECSQTFNLFSYNTLQLYLLVEP